VQQIAKHFAEQLHKALDDLGVPIATRERAAALSKMLDIPKPQANSLLEGHMIPDNELLEQIATELEVEPNWLLGDKKK
jgi:transcriptional regulator with XRE-family HTH domain